MSNIIFHFHPHTLEESLPASFSSIRQEITSKLEKCFEQKAFKIKEISIGLEQNVHLGAGTYKAEIKIIPESSQADFVYSLEGKEYLAIIREVVNSAIEYVHDQKERLED
jgi:hypothetical protein